MKHGTIKTLGVAAAGAAMAAGAAGTAAAAEELHTGRQFANIAADTTNMTVEDSAMDLPANVSRAAHATTGALDRAERRAEEQGHEKRQGPVDRLLGGLPVNGGLPIGADVPVVGDLPVVGEAVGSGNMSTSFKGDLAGGGLPIDGVPLDGGLPIGL
ncbi:hypothetical protein [Streptomyces alkaliterrae]|uniref:ATP-binding protein n=1 Tax=Streptomyces alkaliterrae TaxID=2213162 RepID=A0A5P0YML1_9ACTN|nr:hypothetical protein [Streptomyces alkaliterrae]MBB1252286.1 hypothetical protein [Streptomyces alkaliterrae]MBB1262443.1 hypothetical protein [Streptomyces alkaliterrae]MQS01150.1 hypothetical protein [Streptomyces alkaliterrae]